MNDSSNVEQPDRMPFSLGGLDLYLLRFDAGGRILYASQALCRYLGLDREELVGRDRSELGRFFNPELMAMLEDPSRGGEVRRVADEARDTVLEVKVTWRNGAADAVLQDVTDDAVFRNYVLKYIPVEMREASDEELHTFRYPERRFMTVSFIDLRGFTAMAETMGPEEVRTTLNHFLEEAIGAVEAHRGTVDKIMGDEVMAMFGAPRYYRDHALRAVKTACEQMRRMAVLRASFLEVGKQLPDCGAGINTGDMVVGNIGSASRQDYTVLGGAVNVASRLCEAARPGEILTTESTLRAVLEVLPEGWEAVEVEWAEAADAPDPGGKIEGVYVLPGPLENKAVLIGPAVAGDTQRAEYGFRYLYSLKMKGIEEPLPVLSVFSFQEQGTLQLDEGRLVERQAERIFGKYRLVEMIGRGGMGEIWKGRDGFGNVVAIKTLIAGQAATDRQIRRFKREAETLARLAHRGICRILEVGEVDQVSYIAMEYVDGVDLCALLNSESPPPSDWTVYTEGGMDLPELVERLKSGVEEETGVFRVLPEAQILDMVQKICSAVQYAHSHGVTHRDLKPANIMVRTDGEPIVTDFGLAKVRSEREEASLSLSGQLVGTIEYMAPEQATDSKEVTEAADVYSIGAVLYQMVTGRKHFVTTGNLFADIQALQQHEPVRPRQWNPRVDPDLEVIILKALKADPRERYRSVGALRGDLERYRNGEVITAKEAGLWEVAVKKYRRHRAVAVVALASLACLLAGAVFFVVETAQGRKMAEAARDEARQALALAEEREREAEGARREALANLQKFLDQEQVAREAVRLSQDTRVQLANEILGMARSLERSGRRKEGLDQLQKAVRQCPEYAEAWWQLGQMQERDNRGREALQTYEKAAGQFTGEKRFAEAAERMKRELEQGKTFLGGYIKQVAEGKAQGQDQHVRAGLELAEQGRLEEAVAALRRANAKGQPFHAEARTRQWRLELRMLEPGIDPERVKIEVAGGRIVALSAAGVPLRRLPPMGDLRVERVDLSGTRVEDLAPLAGLEAGTLSLARTPVADVGPLARCVVRVLDLSGTRAVDLGPLAGREYEGLKLAGVAVADFRVLASIRVEELDLSDTGLKEMGELGPNKFRHLGLARTALARIDLPPGMRIRSLDLSGTRVADLAPLAGHPVEVLKLEGTRVEDLSPIAYNVIQELSLAGTPVRTLGPLENLPLKLLDVRGTRVEDVSPLAKCPLEVLRVPSMEGVRGWGVLRSKATLKTVGAPDDLPAAEFWRRWESARSAGR